MTRHEFSKQTCVTAQRHNHGLNQLSIKLSIITLFLFRFHKCWQHTYQKIFDSCQILKTENTCNASRSFFTLLVLIEKNVSVVVTKMPLPLHTSFKMLNDEFVWQLKGGKNGYEQYQFHFF